MRQSHPFEPIIDERSRVLILGSFPSLKSFEQNFYYAHPRNQFWPIMESLFGVTLPDNDAKRRFALEHCIAMWDVYGSVRRSEANSSDANLSELLPNDFRALLAGHPGIRRIYFTGRKAEQGFKRFFADLEIETVLLPSTSPAHAAMTFDQKRAAYSQIKEFLDSDI